MTIYVDAGQAIPLTQLSDVKGSAPKVADSVNYERVLDARSEPQIVDPREFIAGNIAAVEKANHANALGHLGPRFERAFQQITSADDIAEAVIHPDRAVAIPAHRSAAAGKE